MANAYLNATNATEGENLIAHPIASQIISNINQKSGLLQLLRKWPMSDLTEEIPLLTASSTATYNSSEAGAKTGTQPTFGQITLTAKELAAIVVLTERFIDNSKVENIAGLVQQDLVDAFVTAKEKEYAGYGGSVYTHNLTTDTPVAHTVAYGANADLLVDISEAMGYLEEDGYTDFAFITHPAVKKRFRNLRDDDGGLILLPGTANSPDTLFGYPIKYSTAFEKVGSPSGYELFIADWSKIIEGVRQEIRIGKSKDASIVLSDGTTVNLFQKNMVAIKAWLYAAFEIADVNALAKVTGL